MEVVVFRINSQWELKVTDPFFPPTSMNLLMPIVQEYHSISIDAQGKLRPSGSALDPIDWDMAETYLINALHLVR